MKFAQYLRDTQTPEWKKAYIDYRGLKKRITAIRKAQQGTSFHVSSHDDSPDETNELPNAPRPSDIDSDEFERSDDLPLKPISSNEKMEHDEAEVPKSITSRPRRPSLAISTLRQRGKSFTSMTGSNGPFQQPSLKTNPLAALPLHELLTYLSAHEVSFFTMLDAQLDKVETFYLAREKEMLSRGYTLKRQLNELKDHQRLFLDAHPHESWSTTITSSIRNITGLYPPLKVPSKWAIKKGNSRPPTINTRTLSIQSNPACTATLPTSEEPVTKTSLRFLPSMKTAGKRKDVEYSNEHSSEEDKNTEENTDMNLQNLPLSSDPDGYLYAKRKLKKAVIEHYRGLEVLHNYRVLNITGFRKALKKFEKITKIPVQQQYMTEKVEQSAFASDKAVRQMMTQMEEMYASAFVRGDKKKAVKRLRVGGSSKNHHFSTFRSGILLGIALPAFIDGMVKVFQPHTQAALPQWGALLYVYSFLLVPVLFSLLVGFNVLVWANARINYVFIFELDILTQLDHREYFETPALLLASLCYAFWLSFSLIGPSNTWPLIWLAFTAIVVFNPLPLLFRSSRYWLVKNVAKLLISGTKRVEFTDFWMGDQFCSLVYTLSNLYFFACVYVDGFSPDWKKCNVSSNHWPVAFAGAALPLFIRLVQSIRRYADSKLVTHLINGGKYGSGIIAYFFLFLWRHHQVNHGAIFALFIFTSIAYSIYALTWDLLMDWSMFKLHAPYPLLREELVYTDHIPAYYFAIVTNFLIRFIWVIYIPTNGPSMMVRSFIAGMLEMLRRIQWNFYRLENEHLGNMDQYRVTREVPLPYAVDDRSRDYTKDDDDDDDDHHLQRKR